MKKLIDMVELLTEVATGMSQTNSNDVMSTSTGSDRQIVDGMFLAYEFAEFNASTCHVYSRPH